MCVNLGKLFFWSNVFQTWKKILIQYKAEMAINARYLNCLKALKAVLLASLENLGYIDKDIPNTAFNFKAIIWDNSLYLDKPKTPICEI